MIPNPSTALRKIITNLCLVIQSHKLNFIKTLIIWQSSFLKASGSTSFVKIFKWSLNWIRSFYQGWKIQVIIIGILARIRIIIWIRFFIRFWTEKKDSKLHIYMCPLILKLSNVLKLLILTSKIPVRIKTRYSNQMLNFGI